MIMGFIIHFYIIFGTNLLTEAQPRFVVLCLFQCFEEKEYQMESKRNEINWRSYFWKESHPKDLECMSGDTGGAHEGGGRPLPHGTPRSSSDVPPAPIYTYVPKNFQNRT